MYNELKTKIQTQYSFKSKEDGTTHTLSAFSHSSKQPQHPQILYALAST
jgi:hypothetical protein